MRFKKVQSKYAPYQVILPKQFQTENVQYVDQRKDAESNLNQQVKKDFKDQKGLEKPKERAIDGREFVSENDCVGKWSDWKTITVVKMMTISVESKLKYIKYQK